MTNFFRNVYFAVKRFIYAASHIRIGFDKDRSGWWWAGITISFAPKDCMSGSKSYQLAGIECGKISFFCFL